MKRRATPPVRRVLLRLPADLHRTLTKAAAVAGVSFNEFCVRRLRAFSPAEPSPIRATVLARARAVVGADLVGLVAFGSWARGEPAAGSDIDVLIVVDDDQPLTRELYRLWDEAPLTADDRLIDAHFAVLPAPGAFPTSLWCEAAVDGIVWHDRDDAIARRLAEVRRAIADGRVIRAHAHGQTYWKGAA